MIKLHFFKVFLLKREWFIAPCVYADARSVHCVQMIKIGYYCGLDCLSLIL